ncbi:lytic murein transglycosylase [Allokutzneria sp. A3M-2-11 16]|uniref:lytic murein transglycosylase n=1 Tax=Allokutzneria sp. A3M-2-11 16 TaxID=2962043 RepID=UPI0020B7D508|nr:lytic murein transglycosylase [Allokutzneria sp. A3M-2-11 16]MCP3798735.1 lytic murein transglycosylase [Allokutzneria sp. A3M-2-11 16]
MRLDVSWAKRRWSALVVGSLGMAACALSVLLVSDDPVARPRQQPSGPTEPLLPASAPPNGGTALPRLGLAANLAVLGRSPQRQLAGWASSMSDLLNVPRAALQAYGYATIRLQRERPACRITWTVLAGIGQVESNHGRFNGARLGPDARPTLPIRGLPLDGRPGVKSIPDSDGGRLDGDTVWDRAVGPMQFIPTTWRDWEADADGDGLADPNDLDDAALAAARYLCASGGDLGTEDGWWRGVLTYNESRRYAQDVLDRADRYGRLSRRL